MSQYLATRRFQHPGIFHRFFDLWENSDFARDRHRELLVGKFNCLKKKCMILNVFFSLAHYCSGV